MAPPTYFHGELTASYREIQYIMKLGKFILFVYKSS
jgi:hypothetical protein